MADALLILLYFIQVYSYLVLARVIVEMVASFSRSWSPRGVLAVLFEWLFVATDPPIRALRKVIPPLRIGSVALDMSVLVLFLLLWVLQVVIGMVRLQVL